jgi:hypothetical protein
MGLSQILSPRRREIHHDQKGDVGTYFVLFLLVAILVVGWIAWNDTTSWIHSLP